MEWIQSGYCSRDRCNVSAAAIAPTNKSTAKKKPQSKRESANVFSLQRGQIRKVECRHRSSKSNRMKSADERTMSNKEQKPNHECVCVRTLESAKGTRSSSTVRMQTRSSKAEEETKDRR